jgi:hypothetical protein
MKSLELQSNPRIVKRLKVVRGAWVPASLWKRQDSVCLGQAMGVEQSMGRHVDMRCRGMRAVEAGKRLDLRGMWDTYRKLRQ